MWLKRGVWHQIRIRSALAVAHQPNQEVLMTVIIGVDPHKAEPHRGGDLWR